jgi:mono/diheme cytochrome c family protein
MRPGEACVGCHSNFTIAGTVYPTGHEPNDCNGVGTSAGASVIITPASGSALTLAVNSVGNFYSTTRITTPYTAKVQTSKGTRAMAASQTNGNCNSCHTQNGASSAPGRIVVP